MNTQNPRGPRRNFRPKSAQYGDKPRRNDSAPKPFAKGRYGEAPRKNVRKTPEIINAVPTFPMRLNRYLAWKGHASRRSADILISRGGVLVNGRVAVLGEKVQSTDEIVIKNSTKSVPKKYFIYHKAQNQNAEEAIKALGAGVFPVENLEREASGVILCSDDGRITRALQTVHVPSRYTIRFSKPVSSSFMKILEVGAKVDNKQFAKIENNQESPETLSVVLEKVKLSEFKEIASHFGFDITAVHRNHYGPFSANGIEKGTYRSISQEEFKHIPILFGLQN